MLDGDGLGAGPAVLYVDDDRPNLDLFRRWFDEEFDLVTAESGDEALRILATREVGLLVSDQRMPGMTGVELLARVAAQYPEITRVLLTAYSDRELLLDAINRGRIHDYVLKVWDIKDMGVRLRAGLDAYQRRVAALRAESEVELLREELRRSERDGAIVGLSGGLRAVAAPLTRVARAETSVLVRGETGSGRKLLAREIHRRSRRAAGPFVRLRCLGKPAAADVEAALFGTAPREDGTGDGTARRFSHLELAQGGTLLIDDIADVPFELQRKLLVTLREKRLERPQAAVQATRVPGRVPGRLDVRLIATTRHDVPALAAAGRFDADLARELAATTLLLPPLRERRPDLESLCRHFLSLYSAERKVPLTLTPAAAAAVQAYDWPGNVRELQMVLERGTLLLGDEEGDLDVAHLMIK